MVVCDWQKSTVFPYHWLFSGEMTRNDAYLKQMLVDCIIVRDGKSSCSQAVSIRRWLSGHFISFSTGGTESLTLRDNCHLCYCCFEFPHFPDAAMADTHTFKNKLHFSLYLSCHMLPSHFTFHFAIQISSPLHILFFPFLTLLFFLLVSPSFMFSFSFTVFCPLFISCLSSSVSLFFSLPLNYFLFLSTQYVNKTFDHSNIFCLFSSGF